MTARLQNDYIIVILLEGLTHTSDRMDRFSWEIVIYLLP